MANKEETTKYDYQNIIQQVTDLCENTHKKRGTKKVKLNWGNLVVFNMVEMTKNKRTKLKMQNSLWDWKTDLYSQNFQF